MNNQNPEDVCAQIYMMPAYDDGDETNKSFSKYTSSGQIQMTITNPKAIDAFEEGKMYFVDFTPAE